MKPIAPGTSFTELGVGYRMPKGSRHDRGRIEEWGMMPHPDLAVVTGAFSYTGKVCH